MPIRLLPRSLASGSFTAAAIILLAKALMHQGQEGLINFQAFEGGGGRGEGGDLYERGRVYLNSLEGKDGVILFFSEMSPSFNEYEAISIFSVLKMYDKLFIS